MIKRKEFIVGAAAGLLVAAAATAGGLINWPDAHAQNSVPADALLVRTNGQPTFSPPPGAPLSFADIVDAVSPAVVSIDVRTRVDASQLGGIPGFENFPFDILPRPDGQAPPDGQDAPDGDQDEDGPSSEQFGSGSGFFISSDGYIVTNNHVVENAEEITVTLNDDRELTATLVGTDPETDLAVIRVEGSDFPHVQFETEARPRVGDWVLAIGNPLGLGGTVTAGVVSAYGRQTLDPRTPYVDYLQIDAPINRGNSGGPTFDIHGRVIGVNSAILSPNGYSVGIGFAIPADVAQRVTQQLIRDGAVERGYVGIEIRSVDSSVREALALPDDVTGAIVGSVNEDGPADRAGLQEGDIVVGVNGESVRDNSDLMRRVGAVNANESVALDVLRGDQRVTLNIRAASRPSAQELAELNAPRDIPDLPEPGTVASTEVSGVSLAQITPRIRELYGLDSGTTGVVITDVPARSSAARLGFRPGDVILRADNRPVGSPQDLSRILNRLRSASRPSVLLSMERAGQGLLAVVELDDLPATEASASTGDSKPNG